MTDDNLPELPFNGDTVEVRKWVTDYSTGALPKETWVAAKVVHVEPCNRSLLVAYSREVGGGRQHVESVNWRNKASDDAARSALRTHVANITTPELKRTVSAPWNRPALAQELRRLAHAVKAHESEWVSGGMIVRSESDGVVSVTSNLRLRVSGEPAEAQPAKKAHKLLSLETILKLRDVAGLEAAKKVVKDIGLADKVADVDPSRYEVMLQAARKEIQLCEQLIMITSMREALVMAEAYIQKAQWNDRSATLGQLLNGLPNSTLEAIRKALGKDPKTGAPL